MATCPSCRSPRPSLPAPCPPCGEAADITSHDVTRAPEDALSVTSDDFVIETDEVAPKTDLVKLLEADETIEQFGARAARRSPPSGLRVEIRPTLEFGAIPS